MPYLLAVQKESYRLFSVLAVLLRVAPCDLDVRGYRIPKGTALHVSRFLAPPPSSARLPFTLPVLPVLYYLVLRKTIHIELYYPYLQFPCGPLRNMVYSKFSTMLNSDSVDPNDSRKSVTLSSRARYLQAEVGNQFSSPTLLRISYGQESVWRYRQLSNLQAPVGVLHTCRACSLRKASIFWPGLDGMVQPYPLETWG